MKIQNYAVAMNAQYFSLQMQSTEAKISNTTQDFTNESSEVTKIDLDKTNQQNTSNELTRELSKALLKNINNETQRLVGDRIEISTTYAEAQSLKYQLKALIQTDDKEIELSLDVSLSRSFVQKTSIMIDLPKTLTDPLVISLNGTMPTLSSNTFSFDIDSDGESDQISKLTSGNGFLALDKNENGIIDDGSELFGTKSGDGFADLSKYDDDKNGWIDENDKIFNKLRIWQKTDGLDSLVAIGELGIGAIFLGNTSTPFSLKSNTNELLGEIRKSSFVLFEDGKAGVISQVDLAVTDETKNGISMLDKLQKNISIKNIDNLYANNTNNNQVPDDSRDGRMIKIRGKISKLEMKLAHAHEVDRPALQAQIGALYAQMMALLES